MTTRELYLVGAIGLAALAYGGYVLWIVPPSSDQATAAPCPPAPGTTEVAWLALLAGGAVAFSAWKVLA